MKQYKKKFYIHIFNNFLKSYITNYSIMPSSDDSVSSFSSKYSDDESESEISNCLKFSNNNDDDDISSCNTEDFYSDSDTSKECVNCNITMRLKHFYDGKNTCKFCIKKKKEEKREDLDTIFRKIIQNSKKSVNHDIKNGKMKKDEVKFDIDIPFLKNLYNVQDGKCFITREVLDKKK